MGESFKAVCAVVFIFASIFAVGSWADNPQPNQPPSDGQWIARVVTPLLALLSIVVLLKLQFRRDLAPDYLRTTTGNYYNRDGFCFAFGTRIVDGVCHFDAYFQNQYERPSVGRIALRPAQGFFLTRAKIETVTFEIECVGGGFGVATLPIPLPRKTQGKCQEFEVGTSVEYANGKGKRLRFSDGIFIRANTNFGNSFGTALVVAGALAGAVVLSKPAKVKIQLPFGVAEELPENIRSECETIWKPGDLPINFQIAHDNSSAPDRPTVARRLGRAFRRIFK